MRRKKKGLYRQSSRDEQREDLERLQASCVISIKEPHYHCEECLEYETKDKKELIQHYIDKHGLQTNFIGLPPINPFDVDYIVLKYIIGCIDNLRNDLHSRARYLTISNMELWLHLCERLNINPLDKEAPSKQMPRNILNRLELLQRGDREKSRLGYDKKGNRIYNINTIDVEKAVSKTNFGDLLIRLGLLDTGDFGFREAPRPLNNKNKDDKKDNEDTGELFEWKDEDCDTTPEPLPDVGNYFDNIKNNEKKNKKPKPKPVDDYDEELII